MNGGKRNEETYGLNNGCNPDFLESWYFPHSQNRQRHSKYNSSKEDCAIGKLEREKFMKKNCGTKKTYIKKTSKDLEQSQDK